MRDIHLSKKFVKNSKELMIFLLSYTVLLRCMWAGDLIHNATISTKKGGVLDKLESIVNAKSLGYSLILGDDLRHEGSDSGEDLGTFV